MNQVVQVGPEITETVVEKPSKAQLVTPGEYGHKHLLVVDREIQELKSLLTGFECVTIKCYKTRGKEPKVAQRTEYKNLKFKTSVVVPTEIARAVADRVKGASTAQYKFVRNEQKAIDRGNRIKTLTVTISRHVPQGYRVEFAPALCNIYTIGEPVQA